MHDVKTIAEDPVGFRSQLGKRGGQFDELDEIPAIIDKIKGQLLDKYDDMILNFVVLINHQTNFFKSASRNGNH